MLGKTHMAVGIAATLAVTQPNTLPELLLAVGGGAVGSLISDIDVGTSESHRDADKITLLTVAVTLTVIALDYFLHTNIIARIITRNGYVRVLGGIFLFIGICAFGKEQPHRSFMHSFLALILLNFAVGLVWGSIVPYFMVGFLSHLATDVFNRRKLRVLYPLPWGISLNLFHANGVANKIVFNIGSAVAIVEILRFGLRYIL